MGKANFSFVYGEPELERALVDLTEEKAQEIISEGCGGFGKYWLVLDRGVFASEDFIVKGFVIGAMTDSGDAGCFVVWDE